MLLTGQKIVNALGSCWKLKLLQPPNQTVTTQLQGLDAAQTIGYPLMVRPSYVLGGRNGSGLQSNELKEYLTQAVSVSMILRFTR